MAYITNKEKFLKLPENTVYRSYIPCILGDLEIKGESLGSNDFWIQDLDNLDADDSGEMVEMLEEGKDIRFDLDCESREGIYDDTSLYLVYEDKDLQQLIDRLAQCLNPAPQ